jgi:hypothetical protein
MIGYLFWLNRIDSSPIQGGLDSGQVKEILVTGLGVLVHVNRICAWVKMTPHLNTDGNKQYIHLPVMRCQNGLLHIGCSLSGTDPLTVLSGRFFSGLPKGRLHERPGLGM